VAGAVIDREGVAWSFALACSLFAVANVIGGLAPSMPVVALSRFSSQALTNFGLGVWEESGDNRSDAPWPSPLRSA